MRLFLFTLSFSFFSVLCFSRDLSFIPLKESSLTAGSGYLTEDITILDKKSSLHFFNLESSYAKGGSRWSSMLYLPHGQLENHYRGEIVHCQIKVNSKGQIKLDGIEYTGMYFHSLQGMRAGIFQSIRDILGTLGHSGALLESLILGKKDKLKQEDGLFRKAGVSHLLALSGLHRGIITLLILLILKPIIPRNLLGILVMIILMAYTYLIGVKHSLIRAVMMYGFLVLADLYKLKPSLIKILVISLVIQIIIWPESIKSLSLQLSYLAMGGIIFLANPFHYMLKRAFPQLLAIPLSLSLSAQIALFPLLIQVFGEVQLWGIVSGILLTPLITLFIWTGLIFLPLLFVLPPISSLAEFLLNLQYELIMKIVTFFSHRNPVRIGELSSQLLFLFSLSVMFIRIILPLVKEVILVRKSFRS